MADARITVRILNTHLTDFAGRAWPTTVNISLITVPASIPTGRAIPFVTTEEAASIVLSADQTAALEACFTTLADVTCFAAVTEHGASESHTHLFCRDATTGYVAESELTETIPPPTFQTRSIHNCTGMTIAGSHLQNRIVGT